MSCLLYVNDEEAKHKIDIDQLYEKKHQQDLKQVSIFNKILNRIHNRIKLTSRNKRSERYIWFTVPDFIFGEPNYDQGECLGFIITKLEENGFFTNYMHPNTLFVSWENWIPSYTRNEIKKKMGVVLDEKGNIIERLDENQMGDESVTGGIKVTGQKKDSRQFTPIEKYKPTGNLVYHPEMFEKLEKKVSFSPGV
jgi:hypothetical protein|uniref:Uncharacterized protein n=1 Tax=viral metagenome TaxID=1070528 RepID=A0A6C0DXX2_9ZZZZ